MNVCTPVSISGCQLLGLWHAEERFDFGKHDRQSVRIAQRGEEHCGAGISSALLRFLPDAFRHERIELAARGDLTHERERLGRDSKTERCKARRETRGTQHAHGIFDECRRHMSQHFRGEVALTAERIDQCAGINVARQSR